MNEKNPVTAYQRASAAGATPVGLVVALYDTILRDFRRALEALESANVQVRVFELNHALTVIAHLQSVLDFDRGQHAAKTLDRFYNITRSLIVEANAKADRHSLLQLIELYSSLRQAWQEVDRKVPASQQSSPVSVPNPASLPAPISLASSDEASRRASWNA